MYIYLNIFTCKKMSLVCLGIVLNCAEELIFKYIVQIYCIIQVNVIDIDWCYLYVNIYTKLYSDWQFRL